MGAEMTEIKKKTLGTVLCGMFAARPSVFCDQGQKVSSAFGWQGTGLSFSLGER